MKKFIVIVLCLVIAAVFFFQKLASELKQIPDQFKKAWEQTASNFKSKEGKPSTYQEGNGEVVGVSDGDTISLLVLTKGKPAQIKIRLAAIDAPEKSQDYGMRAKERLSEMIYGKTVLLQTNGKDNYGRYLGRLFLNGKDVNLQLIQEGWAWHYKAFDKTAAFAEAEETARSQKHGLWAGPQPEPPWEYRKNKKAKKP